MFVAIAAAVVVAPFGQGFTDSEPRIDPRLDCLETSKGAVALMPPELILGEPVLQAAWSKDGQSLLMIQESKESDLKGLLLPWAEPDRVRHTKILMWDRGTKKTSTVFSADGTDSLVDAYEWLGNSHRAIVTVEQHLPSGPSRSQPETRLVAFEATSGSDPQTLFDETFASDSYPRLELIADRDHSTGYLHLQGVNHQQNDQGFEKWLLIKGSAINPIPIDEKRWYTFAGWDSDSTLHLTTFQRNGQEWATVDPNTGQVKDAKQYKPATQTAKPPILNLLVSPADTKVGDQTRRVNCLWLNTVDPTKHPRAMVCPDPKWYELSPTLDAVAYVSQNSLFVRRLADVPSNIYLDALAQWDKRDAMSRAKQIAVALMMYINDNNDNYPGAGNVDSLISAYLKDNSLLNGFTYTFAGGNAANIESPAETAIGYVDTPTGRAMIYSDGHVKWKNP